MRPFSPFTIIEGISNSSPSGRGLGADCRNNVIEHHDYDLSSRHVQHSLEMRWNGGKNDGVYHVRVFRQVSNSDENERGFEVKRAFEEVEYERNNNGEWTKKAHD